MLFRTSFRLLRLAVEATRDRHTVVAGMRRWARGGFRSEAGRRHLSSSLQHTLRSPIDPAPRLTWVGTEVKLGAGPGQVGLTAGST